MGIIIFFKKNSFCPSGDLNAKAKLGICLRDSPVCVCVCVCFWSVYVWKTWWRCWSCSRHTSPALSIIERSISKTATGLSLFYSSRFLSSFQYFNIIGASSLIFLQGQGQDGPSTSPHSTCFTCDFFRPDSGRNYSVRLRFNSAIIF